MSTTSCMGPNHPESNAVRMSAIKAIKANGEDVSSEPVRHVLSGNAKGMVTTMFPNARNVRGVHVPTNFVLSHDAQVAADEAERLRLHQGGCPAAEPDCTSLLHPACPSGFPLSEHRGDLGTHDPTIATPYDRNDLPFEGRLALAGNHGKWTVPLARDQFAFFGTVPQVGVEHPEVRDLVLRPIAERTTVPPRALRFVPKGTPRSWVLAAVRKLEAFAEE